MPISTPDPVAISGQKVRLTSRKTMGEAKPHGVTGGPSDNAVGNFGTAFLAEAAEVLCRSRQIEPAMVRYTELSPTRFKNFWPA
jgi:hypothetical protein